jgi:hypothetical protein
VELPRQSAANDRVGSKAASPRANGASANGGSNFIVSAAGRAFEFRLPGVGGLYVEREQTWRLTDTASGVFDDVTVELTRDV